MASPGVKDFSFTISLLSSLARFLLNAVIVFLSSWVINEIKDMVLKLVGQLRVFSQTVTLVNCILTH